MYQRLRCTPLRDGIVMRDPPTLPALSSVSPCHEHSALAEPADVSLKYLLNFPKNLTVLEFKENLANLTLETGVLSTASLMFVHSVSDYFQVTDKVAAGTCS